LPRLLTPDPLDEQRINNGSRRIERDDPLVAANLSWIPAR